MDDVRSWDVEAVYDERIFPLMAQIIAVCKEHRIPVLASFGLTMNEEAPEDAMLCTTYLNGTGIGGRQVDALAEAFRSIRPPAQIVAMTITTSQPDASAEGEG